MKDQTKREPMFSRFKKISPNTRFILAVVVVPPGLFLLAWIARAALGAWSPPRSWAETYSALTFVVGLLGLIATLTLFAWPLLGMTLALAAYRDRRDRRHPVNVDL